MAASSNPPPDEVPAPTEPTEPAEPRAPLEAEGEDAPASDANMETLLRRFLSLPPIHITSRPPETVDRSASTEPPEPTAARARQYDALLAELDPHLGETNWDKVLELLSKHETLPPQLALLYAVAQRERNVAADADRVAIAAVAALLSVPAESHAALVVAKRLLRRNPVAWQKRSAPPVRVSIAIALIVALLGALIGFLVGPGARKFW